MTQKVYNLIILDASGSMEDISEQARTGVNETFQTIKNAMKENPEQEHFITFASFNSFGIKTIYDRVSASKVVELQKEDYRPMSGTPLYDAIGTKKAERIMRIVSFILTLSMILFELYLLKIRLFNFPLMFVAVFLTANIFTNTEKYGNGLVKELIFIKNKEKRDISAAKVYIVKENFDKIELVRNFSLSKDHIIFEKNKNGKIKKILTEGEIIDSVLNSEEL